MLQIEGLTKYYGKTLGCKDINLKLNDGEIFGFIGPNGAGKSTTIRCIMNLLNKTSGRVLINGKEFNKNDTETLSIIGYLPSEINLYDNMTVKEMFDFNSKLYNKNCSKRLEEIIDKLKIDNSKKIEDLSLGNLKKVGIALSMMHEPKLLIMDEATNGLDPLIQERFYELLLEEKKKGTTIFFSSHNLSEIKKISDRVGIIKNGSIIKVDDIEKITNTNVIMVTAYTKNTELSKKYKDLSPKEKSYIKFMYSGDINDLLKELSHYKIDKLLIEEPSLEEIFIEYYK